MNKAKKNVAELRNYLQRDTHGLKLLDAVTRDITDQRKRIASLEEENEQSRSLADRIFRENVDVKEEIESLKKRLEAEEQKLRSARKREERFTTRITQLEKEAEVDEEIPIAGRSGKVDTRVQDVMRLFKVVRQRFKRIPPPFGSQAVFRLEDLVEDFTGKEFQDLGMLLAALALHGFPAKVQAEMTISQMDGWSEKNTSKFINWYAGWIHANKVEQKIYGHNRAFWNEDKEAYEVKSPFRVKKGWLGQPATRRREQEGEG